MPSVQAVQHLLRCFPARAGVAHVLEAGSYRICAAAHQVVSHVHGPRRFEVACATGGQQTVFVDGRPCRVSAGDAVVILPGESHGDGHAGQEPSTIDFLVFDVDPHRSRFLDLRGSDALEFQRALLGIGRRSFRLSAEAAGQMKAALAGFERLESAAPAARSRLMRMEAHAHAAAFLFGLLRSAARGAEPRPRGLSERVRRYVEANLGRAVSIADLARETGRSASYFKAQFRREAGLPPLQYVQRLKVDIAKERLAGSGEPVTRMAFALGFSSSQRFATVFRKFTGQSPTVFRRLARGAAGCGRQAQRIADRWS